MATQAKGKFRLIPLPKTYVNLSTEQAAQMLTKDIKNIISRINEDRLVQEIPQPLNVQAQGGSGYAVVGWDDVTDDYRPDLDGARIWRADANKDPESRFDQNSDKLILLSCIRTTKYVDIEVVTGTYIYWIQWINREGFVSNASGGVSATVT